jgi:NADPH:quinone reductase-like Zn-dependent oxidoreductase
MPAKARRHLKKKQEAVSMKAVRILQFGSPDVMMNADVVRPEPGEGQLLVRVKAAGVGPWDALVRQGMSGIHQALPLTLGSDIAGLVEAIGPSVPGFESGEEVYGVTNQQFIGAYAEYAVASAAMMARKPKVLSFIEAAGVPVVTVTAWQMLFEYARVTAGQTILIQGGAGNVGSYAVQMARNAGVTVIATANSADLDYVKSLGAKLVVDYQRTRFEDAVPPVDAVIDTVGGQTRERSLEVLRPGGILVTVVSPPPRRTGVVDRVEVLFFIVDVTTARLNTIAELFQSGKLTAHVGTVLPLEEAREAHWMLAGAAHARGKIVLRVAA